MIQKKCIDNYSFQTPFFSSLYAHAQTDIGVSIDRCNQRLLRANQRIRNANGKAILRVFFFGN